MREPAAELTIVIVNYNTVGHLGNCLDSIFGSRQAVSYRVWVVDNASTDGSPEMVASRYPQVGLIANRENVGFARANNQVLSRLDGDWALLLNSDTLVTDHVFDKGIAFLRQHAEAGMITCKLVQADGGLDLACRRAFPTAFDGFCRAVGLSSLFPRSPYLARYNLTYLDEDETVEVDAVNGAYMLVRRAAMAEVGLLDESYFMYMEDLDWCYRFRQRGWRIFYVPDGTVIHLKGQSSSQNSEAMIRAFFDSMVLFCEKHYAAVQSRAGLLATVCGIRAWERATLWRNSLRGEKRVRP
jgi:N-acetylglucosaminyl-diphospho-decaprenol L-rhamnosyltransferase